MSDTTYSVWEHIYSDALDTLACVTDRDDLDDMRSDPLFEVDYAETLREMTAARTDLFSSWVNDPRAADLEALDISEAIDEAGHELFGHHWNEV